MTRAYVRRAPKRVCPGCGRAFTVIALHHCTATGSPHLEAACEVRLAIVLHHLRRADALAAQGSPKGRLASLVDAQNAARALVSALGARIATEFTGTFAEKG
jgi:predicted amidophosphoribosyltransferase